MGNDDGGTRRPYRMRARAEATAATRERILESVEAAFDELLVDEITLAEIARRAGVSVQTVLRHFESREGLFLATLQHTSERMLASRGIELSGEAGEVVGNLVDHYEEFGDRILRMLSQEDRQAELRMIADLGRAFHVEWCKQAFAPALKGLRGARRERRVAQIAALTDIYIWKLLRRDRALSPAQTKLAIRELLEPLTEASG